METKCVKIKLKPDCTQRAREWAAEINRRSDEALATLRDERVWLECAFLDRAADGDYLVYFMRADDFERSREIAEQSSHPIDLYHRGFKEKCWGERVHLEQLIELAIDAG